MTHPTGKALAIQVEGGTAEETVALAEWLEHEDELRGQISIRSLADDIEPRAVIELLTAALGTGGAVVALAAALRAWLGTHRGATAITVSSAGQSVTLRSQNAADVAPVLEQIPRNAGDG